MSDFILSNLVSRKRYQLRRYGSKAVISEAAGSSLAYNGERVVEITPFTLGGRR